MRHTRSTRTRSNSSRALATSRWRGNSSNGCPLRWGERQGGPTDHAAPELQSSGRSRRGAELTRTDMAQRVSELIGKVVVSANNGEKLGTVTDVLLDEIDHHLVGLVVRRGGLMKSEHVLPSAAVQTFGRDTVVSRTGDDLVGARDWRGRPAAGSTADPSGIP